MPSDYGKIRHEVHPLVDFTYSKFGERFGDFLMTGYGEESPQNTRTILLTEEYEGGLIRWDLSISAAKPPSGEDPLVLAALLKLLLSQGTAVQTFKFNINELFAELGWDDTPHSRSKADNIIDKYIGVNYKKYESGKKSERYKKEGARWGYYKLISGCIWEAAHRPDEIVATRLYTRVDFDGGFIAGLNRGRVYFADVDFGALNP